MEYFKITLRPHKVLKNASYCESLIWESFNILRKTGQVYENFQVVAEDGAYAVYVIMPGADALDLNVCSEETVESIKKLAAIFSLKVTSLGSIVNCDDSCLCEAPSWYMLYTDIGMQESPLFCGDCGKPVPLYKLPAVLDKEGESRFLVWQSQYRALHQLDIQNYSPDYTEREIYDPTSRINKMGRALCRAIEGAKSVPVFYHLERKKAMEDSCPLCHREWSRTANEEISSQLCTFCRIAVGN